MEKFYQSYLERLEKLHQDISKAIEGLPQEALDWSPGPGMNSIDVLITHLTGAERFWIGDIAMQDPSGRVRSREFEARGTGVSALRERLDNNLTYARSALAKLDLKDLAAERPVPRENRSTDVASALLHAMEHTALHLGHIEITRQIWDTRK